MRGYNTLWQPGIDHAGIATQTVGRAAARARGQDPPRARARGVRRARLAVEGARAAAASHCSSACSARRPDWARSQVHDGPGHEPRRARRRSCACTRRGSCTGDTRLINWCPECHDRASATSRSRTRRAPTASSSSSPTRSKGGGGDRRRHDAPRDDARRHRRRRAPGRPALHAPPRQASRCTPSSTATIPIITDAILVDPKFGTGAVKVTPAHDFNDFATGKRHGLEEINILNLDGTLNAQRRAVRRRWTGSDARTRREARRSTRRGSRAAASRTCSPCRAASARAAWSSR